MENHIIIEQDSKISNEKNTIRMGKKKIGILSMQEVVNYGSFLQAFALKTIFTRLGADVCFLKVKAGRQLPGYEYERGLSQKIKWFYGAIRANNLVQRIKGRSKQKAWHKDFHDKFFNLLGVNKVEFNELDLAVIGSDEVFNCVQRIEWGFSTAFFGDIPNAKKVVSYAGSFGHTSYNDIVANGLINELKPYLTNLSLISVRDKNSYEIIKSLIGIDPIINIDPVLVFDFSEFIPDTVKLKNYIIIYSYPYRINKKEKQAIVNFARKHKKLLVSIGCYYDWCDKFILPDTPFEVLDYFKKADYIITDTFHGSIFSMKFQKQFCTIVRESNQQKLGYLLNSLAMSNAILTNCQNLESHLTTPLDYKDNLSILAKEKEKAYNYLQNCYNLI